MEKLEIYPYSINKLVDIFVEKSQANKEYVFNKSHRIYFNDYFNELKAKTILVENNYIDRDYLEDYAAYYVKCFNQYNRKCTRFHFFNIEFNEKDFLEILSKKTSINKLLSSYLGFIVVKPLPSTIIGRTCLKTYPSNNRRYYPITREYSVNLFGIPLFVKSLAFQEQDRVVAACATSALWSALQGTGILFHHNIPTPVEITNAATEYFPSDTRSLPNEGLYPEQMNFAIREFGLEPYFVKANNEYVLNKTIYGYLKIGIPLILAVNLIEIIKEDKGIITDIDSIGTHAVSVTGFSLGKKHLKPYSFRNTLFYNRSSLVDKLYVHDDQLGPFARMTFSYNKFLNKTNNNIENIILLDTSLINKFGEIGKIKAIPEFVLIPLYHKIRIKYASIHDIVLHFDAFLEPLRKDILNLHNKIHWEIYLDTQNNIKTKLYDSTILDDDYKIDLLMRNIPRFIWRANATIDNNPIFDLLFDATDIEQGPLFLFAIEYNKDIPAIIREICSGPKIKEKFLNKPEWKIINWFSKKHS